MFAFIKRALAHIRLKRTLKKHIHRSLDLEEILSRNDDTNVVVDSYEFFMRQTNWTIPNDANDVVKNFLYSVLYDGEVANGGVSYFLCEDSGKYANEIANALHEIGALTAEKHLRTACALFPDGFIPEDEERRNQIIFQLPEDTFNELDAQTYNDDIYSYCYQYLMDNKIIFLEANNK